jgi:hypothetical protein
VSSEKRTPLSHQTNRKQKNKNMKTTAILSGLLLSAVTSFGQALNVQISTTNPTCYGYADGAIVIDISNGTQPYIVNGQEILGSQFIASGITEGTRSFYIEDATALSTTADVTLVSPPPINMQAVVTNVTAPGATDGSIDLTVPLAATFDWTSPNGVTNPNLEDQANLADGYYDVSITESLTGCVTTKRFYILQSINNGGNFFNPNFQAFVQSGAGSISSAMNIYPNPSSGRVNLMAKKDNREAYVLNDMGIRVHTCSVSTEGSVEGIDLTPGTYTLVITELDGTLSTERILVR